MPIIGDFESAWEDYDHTTGPALITEGKDLEKVGSKAPNWRLVIGTENFTRRLINAEVTFSREGESSMQFTVIGNLRAAGYERARVSFWFGYGTKLVPYFRGRLAFPTDAPSGLASTAHAYGLATQLGQRYFLNRADYGGWDLRDAVADIWDRFGADLDRFDFWGEHSTELANDISSFGHEVSLLEALQTVLEPMQFKGYDVPHGMYLVKRGHLADLGTDEVFSGAGHYDPEDYPANGFLFDQSQMNFYSDVVVFRRKDEFAGGGGPGVMGANPAEADSDEYDVYVDKDVAGDSGVADPGPFTVHEGRIYPVPDYPGQQEHAERERELLVTSLSRGVGPASWKCHPIDFSPGDHLTVNVDEQYHDPDYLFSRGTYRQSRIDRVSYAYLIDEITFRMSSRMAGDTAVGTESWAMDTSGLAFEKDREVIRPAGSPTAIDLGVTPYEVPEPGPVDFDYVTVDDEIVTVDGDEVTVGV